ncbi:hypothetical protein Tco_0998959, partial [Tanacetum coccineum]
MKSKLDASTNVLAAETKSESMTDEKMQEVIKELLNIRISQMDVGKAVEICYRDPTKVKVLFTLLNHMRRSYVLGF